MGKSDKEIVYLKSLMLPHLEKSTKSFELISPYFVPGEDGTEYLKNQAPAAGVDLMKTCFLFCRLNRSYKHYA